MAAAVPALAADRLEDRAVELLYWLAGRLREHRPTVCSHQAAFRLLLPGQPAEPWTSEHARAVEQVAGMTASMFVPGLGPVKLDAFLVGEGTGLPGPLHWQHARYDQDQWRYVLGAAERLEA